MTGDSAVPGLTATRVTVRSALDGPLALFMVTALVSAGVAFDRDAALRKLALLVIGVAAYYGLREVYRPNNVAPGAPATWRVLWPGWLLLLAGVGVTGYMVATVEWSRYAVAWPSLVRLGTGLARWLGMGPVATTNPNIAGGALAVLLAPAATPAWHHWQARQWGSALAATALLLVVTAGVVVSGSRGAWLAAAAAGATALLWGAAGRLTAGRPTRRRQVVLGVALAAVLLPALTAAVVNGAALTAALAQLPAVNGTSRWALYRSMAVLALDYPLIGAGLGNFLMVAASYAFLTHVGFLGHAHNLYLDLMIEQGGLGLLAWLWLLATAAVLVWRSARAGGLPPLTGAAALALLVTALHGLVDDPLYSSLAAPLLFVPAALLPDLRQAGRRGWSRLWLAVLLVLPALGLGVLPAGRSWALSNWAAVAQGRSELAVYRWPEWPIQDAVRRADGLAQPVARYERALVLNPANASAARRLGQIALSLGAYEAAREHLATAYAARPWDTATQQLLGEALLVTGDVEAGARLWAGVPGAQGQLDVRAFWYGYIGDEGRAAVLRAAVMGRGGHE